MLYETSFITAHLPKTPTNKAIGIGSESYTSHHSFFVTSGTIHVVDPTFTRDSIFGMFDLNARVGRWHVLLAHVQGDCLSKIIAWQQDFDWNTNCFGVEYCKQVISIESGRIILCDGDFFPCDGRSHHEFVHELENIVQPMSFSYEGKCFVCEVEDKSNGYYDAYIIRDDNSKLVWLCVDFENNGPSSS
jgi:hypothetical protein